MSTEYASTVVAYENHHKNFGGLRKFSPTSWRRQVGPREALPISQVDNVSSGSATAPTTEEPVTVVSLTGSQRRAAELSLLPDIAKATRDRSKAETAWLRTKRPGIDRSYYELGVLDAINAKRNGTEDHLLGQREDGHYFLAQADRIMEGLAGKRAAITDKAKDWTDDDAGRMTQVVQSEVGGFPSHIRDTVCDNYQDLGLRNKNFLTRTRETAGEVATTVTGYGAVDIFATSAGVVANTINKLAGSLHSDPFGYGVSSSVLALGTTFYGWGLYKDGVAAVNSARERGVGPNVAATRALRWAQRHTDNIRVQNAIGIAGSLIPNAFAEIVHAPDYTVSTAIGGAPALLLTLGVENLAAGVGLVAHAELTPHKGEARLSQRVRDVFRPRSGARSANSSDKHI